MPMYFCFPLYDTRISMLPLDTFVALCWRSKMNFIVGAFILVIILGQRINLVGGLPGQEYSFESLYMKNLMSVTPLNCVLKALIFALNDSAEALVR